jgi:hypothetical protein
MRRERRESRLHVKAPAVQYSHAGAETPSDRAPHAGWVRPCQRSHSVNGLGIRTEGGEQFVGVYTLSGEGPGFLGWLTTGSRAHRVLD